ncbi:MAG TPA: hydrogenase [Bdellovibrionota bacterium]|nr:hydrogenase [Bdellovibrionota bacterium]
MTGITDFFLLLVVLIDLYLLATSRMEACIRASALQGLLLAVLLFLFASGGSGVGIHYGLIGIGTALVKGMLIPLLLRRALRVAKVRREVEPMVSLHVSVFLGVLLVVGGFWLGRTLVFPRPMPTTLLLPAAFSTLFIGFLILVSRKKAITQVVGYLVLENGVFLCGMGLVRDLPFVVELGILLDVLVGVFVMGIAVHHIAHEFDDIDVGLMVSLRE